MTVPILAAYASVLLEGVPHVEQKPDYCGEACVEMVLKWRGRSEDQDWVFAQSGVDPELDRGVYTAELAVALRKIGFDPGGVWHRVDRTRARTELDELWREMHADLRAGIPSIICMHYDDSPKTTEHFRLILGYDSKSDEVIFHEPAKKHGAYQRMKRELMLKLWPLKYDRDSWTVIRLRLPNSSTAGAADR